MKKWICSLCVIIAFAFLILPLGMMLTGFSFSQDTFNENRELSRWPVKGNLTQRLKGIEEYINDHLGLREQMIQSVLHMDLMLGESTSDSVIVGRDGWLYYDEGESILDMARKLTVDPLDLDMVAEAQLQINDMVTEAGSVYRVMIAPDKHTVYPQHLPIKCVIGEGPSQLDQVYAHLRENTGVSILDLRAGLKKAAEKELVYYKTDTHWNTFGAYTAYRLLMEDLKREFPTLRVLTDEDVTRRQESRFAGDLSGMAGARDIYFDRVSDVAVKEAFSRREESLDRDGMAVYVNPDFADAPSMLLLHDSFGPAIIPFLRESVSRLYVSDQDGFTAEMLTGEVPDIVIIERVERNVLWLGNGVEEIEYYDEEYEEEF